jgi:hypothetical protein
MLSRYQKYSLIVNYTTNVPVKVSAVALLRLRFPACLRPAALFPAAACSYLQHEDLACMKVVLFRWHSANVHMPHCLQCCCCPQLSTARGLGLHEGGAIQVPRLSR